VILEDWGEEIFAEGVGVKLRKWVRGEGEGEKLLFFFSSPAPAPYPASAPTLYRSSIQLQSKMAATKRFI